MTKRLVLTSKGFNRRTDLDFSDDGSYFTAYDYKGLPITYTKYDGEYFLCIRVDYLYGEVEFTYEDWRKTDECKLTDEFNGCTEVDVDKLIENCEKILAKINELNEQVMDEYIDMQPVIKKLSEEIDVTQEIIDGFKKNFRWYDASAYDLKRLTDYMKSQQGWVDGAKQLLSLMESQQLEQKDMRYYSQRLTNPGYIRFSKDDFYSEELKNAVR